MAGWSQLPPELLTLIAKRLEIRFDVLRFRSVCSSWRSSFPPKVYRLPKYLPPQNKTRYQCSLGGITRDTFVLVRLPGSHDHQAAPGCWLVKIRDGTVCVRMQLLQPLSDSKLKYLPPVPASFPKSLNTVNTQKTVAIIWPSTNSDDFMMLAEFHVLAVLRSGEMEWTLLQMGSSVEDMISFNGKSYAIELD
ncbi:Uncharacterized protein TCM_006535 [Theobroma cacao]|uniref:F-box domain-containing protein n=1 Tax=Theobroma cacao TaxID=3641 RepID=A0A061DXM9_THECC|nr:Uncharacterized protein TCM_006535 [Theobroma cacao]